MKIEATVVPKVKKALKELFLKICIQMKVMIKLIKNLK